MSEFECSCGELIAPSKGRCSKCGGRPVRMDGMSIRELSALENMSPDEEEDAVLGDDGEEIIDYPEDDIRENR